MTRCRGRSNTPRLSLWRCRCERTALDIIVPIEHVLTNHRWFLCHRTGRCGLVLSLSLSVTTTACPALDGRPNKAGSRSSLWTDWIVNPRHGSVGSLCTHRWFVILCGYVDMDDAVSQSRRGLCTPAILCWWREVFGLRHQI